MAEVLVVFDKPIDTDAGPHDARVCGGIADDGLWEGWVEFRTVGSTGSTESDWFRSPRETEQPNVTALRYWAEGLSVTYLQGALERAIKKEGPAITHTDILAATQEYHAEERPAGRTRKSP